jgi:hypothetical protein
MSNSGVSSKVAKSLLAWAKVFRLEGAKGELVGTDLPPDSALVGRSFPAGARRCIVEISLALRLSLASLLVGAEVRRGKQGIDIATALFMNGKNGKNGKRKGAVYGCVRILSGKEVKQGKVEKSSWRLRCGA